MRSSALKSFARRVQLLLSWALLLGLWVNFGLGRTPASELQILERAAVVLSIPAGLSSPSVVSRPAYSNSSRAVEQQRVPFASDLRKLPKKQRVVAWFTIYDEIRRDAQMTPVEKADALRLWASSYVQSTGRDSEDARAILNRMVLRYATASKQLAALPQIPETVALHKGYLEYFRRAHRNFRSYVVTLDKKSVRAALTQMQEGRHELSAIDARNKSLDRQLRKKLNIKEFSPG